MATPVPMPKTEAVQTITFTPLSPVCKLVIACAGPVEIVEEEHGRRLLPDHSRIYRVRSLKTGALCWAFIHELTIQTAELTIQTAELTIQTAELAVESAA
jgi:hypothetical protein